MMISFLTLFFVCQLLLAKGEPTLHIFKTINGTDVPVSYRIREVAGTNFTLTCKLSPGNDGDTTDYLDDTISWGWKRKNLEFFNAGDLKKLAEENSNLLRQFINKNSNDNQATIPFEPLLSIDSGKYFCMSLKYKLFNIIKIHVIQNSKYDHPNYDKKEEMNFQRYSKSSLLCTDDMFMCNSRTFCVSNKYLCDKFDDCIDGSDENNYLCNTEPCKDGVSCSINQRATNLEDLPTSEDIINQFMTAHNDDNQFPKFEVQTFPSFTDLKKDLDLNQPEIYTINYDNHTRGRNIWYLILLPIGIILSLLRICSRLCKSESRSKLLLWRVSTVAIIVPDNSSDNSSPEDAASNKPSENEDLPPTYDEAVVNVPQNTSLLK